MNLRKRVKAFWAGLWSRDQKTWNKIFVGPAKSDVRFAKNWGYSITTRTDDNVHLEVKKIVGVLVVRPLTDESFFRGVAPLPLLCEKLNIARHLPWVRFGSSYLQAQKINIGGRKFLYFQLSDYSYCDLERFLNILACLLLSKVLKAPITRVALWPAKNGSNNY